MSARGRYLVCVNSRHTLFLQKIECDYYFPQKMVKYYVDDFVKKMHNFVYSMINWN